MPVSRLRGACCAVVLMACLVPGPALLPAAHAQNRVGTRTGSMSRTNPYQELQNRFSTTMSGGGGLLALEGAVPPDEYRVGPGDQFIVTVGGAVPTERLAIVAVDGTLSFPEVGGIDVAGQSLEEVRTSVLASLRGAYQNVPLELSLIQPRQFYVHIAGAVPEPGRYLVLPVARVDDALQQAFAGRAQARPNPEEAEALEIPGSATSERPALLPPFHPSIRNIRLIHRDGTEESLDLFHYYQEGDTRHNPYLLDGDLIQVPSYHEDRDAVVATGEIAQPGKIEYRPGDTVLDILRIAAGAANLDRLRQVRLTRRGEGATTTSMLIDVPGALAGTEPAPEVQPGDRINVLPDETDTAAIYGYVVYPGTYDIESGHTTLRELVDMAGGLKPEASVRAAYLERRQSNMPRGGGRTSDLNFFERAYLQQSLAQNRVAIDVETALQPDAPDVVLYNGDVLTFPRDEQTIFVTGNVAQPGYVPHRPGWTARQYIEAAGGMAPLTTGVYVFVAGSGEVLTDDGVVVEPGDVVFVNREPLAETPELQSLLISDQVSKRQTRIMTVQTVITGITAAVGVINTFLLVRDRLNN